MNTEGQTHQEPGTSSPARERRAHRRGDAIALLLLCTLSLALYRQIALTNLILSGVDAMTYFYPYRAYAAQAVRGGQIPLWNPYLFLGVPFLANPQSGVLYPLNLALCWLSAPKLVAWSIVIHTAIAAVTAYLYARRVLRLSPLAAFLGASTFALGGYLSGQAGHVNQLNVLAWFPLLLTLWEERTRARWPALLGLGAVIGLGLLAGHTQSTYISLAGLGVYALLPAFLPRRHREQREEERENVTSPRREPEQSPGRNGGPFLLHVLRDSVAHLWQLAVALLVGLGLAAVQLLPTLELSRLSIRSGGLSYREAVAFSLKPLPRLLRYTFLPPWGSNLSAVYGGDFYTEFVAYVGLVPLLLALLAFTFWLVRVARAGPVSLHETSSRTTLQLIVLAALGVFLALGLYNPLYLVLYKVVPGLGLFRVPARWLFFYAFGAAMLAGIGLQQVRHLLYARPALGRATTLLLVAIGLGGLYLAARALPLSHPTAPEAFSSLRTAPAHILAAQQEAAQRHEAAPGRFLSMSDILFDPGDLREIQQMYQDQLSPQAIYDYVVNVKRQEILTPNLPLAWGIYAVDGYDGGVLPLARYAYLQRLFLDERDILSDGRLREGLTHIPPSRLLSILGARCVIADKVNDVWIDDVFYDLAFDTVLGTEGVQAVSSDDLPAYAATGLGIVSYLEGAQAVADGTPVAEVRLWTVDGEMTSTTLRAGMETAEGVYREDVAHAQARVGRQWKKEEGETTIEGHDYVHRWNWETAQQMARIEIEALPGGGQFHLRGATLADRRDGSNVPLILSNDGRYRRVHSGDVKVYEALDTLPRAYVVHQARLVADDKAALAAMADPAFNPADMAILAAGAELTMPPAGDERSQLTVTSYAPHEIVLQAALQAPGYVVLSESWYPGWQATVDGAPARIERANLNFRAVYVPTGEHTVRLAYRPTSYRAGLGISVVTLLAVTVGAIGIRIFSKTRRPD